MNYLSRKAYLNIVDELDDIVPIGKLTYDGKEFTLTVYDTSLKFSAWDNEHGVLYKLGAEDQPTSFITRFTDIKRSATLAWLTNELKRCINGAKVEPGSLGANINLNDQWLSIYHVSRNINIRCTTNGLKTFKKIIVIPHEFYNPIIDVKYVDEAIKFMLS